MSMLDELFLSKRNKSFISFTDRSDCFTFGQVYDMSSKVAYILEMNGVVEGNNIIILMNNQIEDILAYYAALKLGAIPLLLNSSSNDATIISISEKTETSIIVGYEESQVLNGIKTLKIQLDELETVNDTKEYSFDYLERPESVIVCLCTSGTRDHYKIAKLLYKGWLKSAFIFADLVKYYEETRVLQMMPFFHGTGWFTTCILPLINGSRVVVLKNSLSKFIRIWDIIKKSNINYVVLMPSIMSTMLMLNSTPINNTIEYVNSSSDYLSPSLKKTFENVFGVKVIEDYSSTEAGIISVTDLNTCNESVGKLARISDVKIGLAGEILVNTKDVFGGYYGMNPPNDWFNTGDIGYIEDDYLFLEGRKDDRININGEKIYPAVIDKLIMGNELVQNSFTVYENSKIVSFVVLNEDKSLSDNMDVNQYLQKAFYNVSGFSWCPYRFYVLDSLPLNQVGKVNKKALLEILNKDTRFSNGD